MHRSVAGRADAAVAALAARYERLEQGRRTGFWVAVGKRVLEIDGFEQSGLLAIELFTTIIPLMIIGFSYAQDFSRTASVGDLLIRRLGLGPPLDETVRAAFSSASDLRTTWTIGGLAGFLIWGIPMSLTVAAVFSRAWRRERFSFGAQLGRGATWFVLYLATMVAQESIQNLVDGTWQRVAIAPVALLPVMAFWALSPVLLVRSGAHGMAFLLRAGLAGVVIDGVILRVAARVVFPMLLEGWTGFGSIGVAMALMTWCGVIGVGWVISASVGAVIWERSAPADVVVNAQS